jgi:hypothetical protein
LHSYRVDGTETTHSLGAMRVTAEVGGPGRIFLVEHLAWGTVELTTLGSEAYVKAPESFWAAQSKLTPALVERFAGRWLKAPTSLVPGLQASVSRLTDVGLTVAQCAAARKGTTALRYAGVGTVAGRAAVVLSNGGADPGAAPGKLYVAASGPTWPLRAIITDPRKPGGPAACADPSETITAADLTLSDFNQPIEITTPTGALDLLQIAAQSAGPGHAVA